MSLRRGSYEQARREAAAALKLEEQRIDRLIAEESRRLTEDMRKITGRDDIGVTWEEDEPD